MQSTHHDTTLDGPPVRSAHLERLGHFKFCILHLNMRQGKLPEEAFQGCINCGRSPLTCTLTHLLIAMKRIVHDTFDLIRQDNESGRPGKQENLNWHVFKMQQVICQLFHTSDLYTYTFV